MAANKGWGLEAEEYPCCGPHGPMTVKTVTEDAAAVGGWRVEFKCRSFTQQCAPVIKGVCPTYVAPAISGPTGKAKRARVVHGEPGACDCTGACKRSCPCASAKQHCTDHCHVVHGSKPVKCKCTNTAVLPVVVPALSVSARAALAVEVVVPAVASV